MAEKKHPAHAMIREVFHFRDEDRPVPWGSSMRYGRGLFPVLFAKCGYTKGAEIGVRKGKFSKVLCAANPQLKLLCVDPWSPYEHYSVEKQDRHYQFCVDHLKDCNVEIIRKTSMDAVKDVEMQSLDFVYIDGNHRFDYVMEDIIHWSRRVRPGGIVSLHDFHYGSNVDVCEAVKAYTRAHHIDPWYVTKEFQPTAYWVAP